MPNEDENVTETGNNEHTVGSPNDGKPPVEIGGFVKHQSEVNTETWDYSQKTGAGVTFNSGADSGSVSIYALNPQKFQIEGIYSRSLFSMDIKNNPRDKFSVSGAYRNQTNFSNQGVTSSNRFSLEESYTHKFDNGWKVGAYVNENGKLNISENVSTSVGYIAGVSFGKGKVSGYVENQGDLKLVKDPKFNSYINIGVKITL